MNRQARVLLGITGILIGLAGFAGILIERRAAKERQRVLTTLAEDFRKREPSTETAVVWEGHTFRPGDRVRIVKWAGTFKQEDTGATVQVSAGAGRSGVVIAGEKRNIDYDLSDPSEPIQIVRVRWFPQQWNAIGSNEPLELPQFEATIHVSYLEQMP
jgi:hypothetical protein